MIVGPRGGATGGRKLLLGLASCAFVSAMLVALAASRPASSASIGCSANALKSAIGAANGTPATADTIELRENCAYRLSSPDNASYGPNGLPAITSEITILGNDAEIRRNSSAPFRLLMVEEQGELTLRDLTLRNGLAQGGDGGSGGINQGGGGGGGGGLGGAIYNRGALRSSAAP